MVDGQVFPIPETNPKNAQEYYQRGYLYDERREFDKAIADFTEAIRLSPKYVDGCNFNLADTMFFSLLMIFPFFLSPSWANRAFP